MLLYSWLLCHIAVDCLLCHRTIPYLAAQASSALAADETPAVHLFLMQWMLHSSSNSLAWLQDGLRLSKWIVTAAPWMTTVCST